MMPFETSLQQAAFVLTEGSVYERLRRHPAVDFDPYLAHAGLLYETSTADVLAQVQAKGYMVGNVDATIVAQAPKMAPHIESMRALIAADLQVELDQVNVKATTTEKLGFTGREEGIAVHAVALLVRA